jgi:hypothetical protein
MMINQKRILSNKSTLPAAAANSEQLLKSSVASLRITTLK